MFRRRERVSCLRLSPAELGCGPAFGCAVFRVSDQASYLNHTMFAFCLSLISLSLSLSRFSLFSSLSFSLFCLSLSSVPSFSPFSYLSVFFSLLFRRSLPYLSLSVSLFCLYLSSVFISLLFLFVSDVFFLYFLLFFWSLTSLFFLCRPLFSLALFTLSFLLCLSIYDLSVYLSASRPSLPSNMVCLL